MASTFYKYAERNVDSQINWSEIGSNIAEMLNSEASIRETKKALIDQQSRDLAKQIAENKLGQNKELNQWWLEFGSDATDALRIQDSLLKSGKLKFKDYSIQRQNLIDGTQQTVDLINAYNTEYDRVIEDYKSGKTSAATLSFMDNIEGFRNFTKSKLVINPTDYSVVIGNRKKDANGNYGVELEDGFTTINALNNRLKTNINLYDVNPDLVNIADKLGTIKIDTLQRGGLGKTGVKTTYIGIQDSYKNEEWFKKMSKDEQTAYQKSIDDFISAEDSFIEGLMANDDNLLSIMMDDLKMDGSGGIYEMQFDKGASGADNVIAVETDQSGRAKISFTDTQREYVKGELKKRVRGMLDSEQLKSTYVEGSGVSRTKSPDPDDQSKRDAESANLLLMLYAPRNQGDLNAGLNYLQSKEAAISKFYGGRMIDKIIRDADGVIIKFEDGSDQVLRYTNNATQWVQSISNLVGIDPVFAIRSQGFDPNAQLNSGISAEVTMFNGGQRQSESQQKSSSIGDMNNLVALQDETDADEDDFAKKLNEQLAGTGWTVTVGDKWTYDSVNVYQDGYLRWANVNIENADGLSTLSRVLKGEKIGGPAAGDNIFGQ